MIDRCVVINLGRRPDRLGEFWERFPKPWCFAAPMRLDAVDELSHPPPDWWSQCQGAWGCRESHAKALREFLESGATSLLILEDDAIFCEGFADMAVRLFESVPGDWQQVYLGGQHNPRGPRPVSANNGLLRCFGVLRTHAYAIRRHAADVMLDWLERRQVDAHIDALFARLHQATAWPVYAPRRWLAGQAAGPSDVAKSVPGRESLVREECWWNDFLYTDEAGRCARAA